MSGPAVLSFVDSYISAADLMSRWGIGRTTLWNYRRTGVPGTSVKLAAIKLGNKLMFKRSAVEDAELVLAAASAPRTRRVRRYRRGAA